MNTDTSTTLLIEYNHMWAEYAMWGISIFPFGGLMANTAQYYTIIMYGQYMIVQYVLFSTTLY